MNELYNFASSANSKDRGLLTKAVANPQKFCKSVSAFGPIFTQFMNIQWDTKYQSATVSEKLCWIKLGRASPPKCKVCGEHDCMWFSNTGEYGEYCCKKCSAIDANKDAKKEIDIEFIRSMYEDELMSILEISEHLGNISNVTLKKRMVDAGIVLRSHSDNQKIHRYVGPYKGPKVTYDPSILLKQYMTDKIPLAVLADEYDCHSETLRNIILKEGGVTTRTQTKIETAVENLLLHHNIEFVKNDKTVIGPKHIDFYIPNNKLGIELHGLYYHTEVSGRKDKKYHEQKYKVAEEKGVQLLQFWESDIDKNWETVKSVILVKCGIISKKIGARNCDLRSITSAEANSFCDQYHLQKKTTATNINYGLFFENSLVAVLIAKKEMNITIILRFCTAHGITINGGFSKLLAKLDGHIVTFSSNMYSNGNLYKMNGFQNTSESMDMYYTNYKDVINRRSFQKHTLQDKLEIYDENLTENENMVKNGYDILWGAGIKKWERNVE